MTDAGSNLHFGKIDVPQRRHRRCWLVWPQSCATAHPGKYLPDERNIMQPTTTPGALVMADTLRAPYLSFRLGGLEYGLHYGSVQELRRLKELDRFSSQGEVLQSVAVSTGVMGMVVDGVTDIVSLAPADITPVAGLGVAEADYLLGVGVVDGRRLILVDIDRLMA